MMIIAKNKTKTPLKKYHVTATIERTIHYIDKKTGETKYIYTVEKHNKPFRAIGHDTLKDSRIVEASSIQEAQDIMTKAVSFDHFQYILVHYLLHHHHIHEIVYFI